MRATIFVYQIINTCMVIVLLTLAGVVISVVVGTFWYSDKTPMGRLHMQYLGFNNLSPQEQQMKINEGKAMMKSLYIKQMLLSLLNSFAVVFIVILSMRNGVTLPLTLAFVAFNWLGFVVPTVGTHILWGNCDPKIAVKKFFSDIFFSLVTMALIALLASLFV